MEILLVVVVVGFAAAWLIHTLYLTLSGKRQGCSCGATECERKDDCVRTRPGR